MDIKIRTLQGEDVKEVVAIWNRALKRDPMTLGRFVASILADADYRPGPDSGFFVAEKEGRPVGFLRAIIRYWPNDRVGTEPEDGWIPVMAVDPDYQRKGIGRALVAQAIDFFREHNRKRIFVCGNTGSAPGYIFPGVDKDAYAGALKLFEGAGFVVDHEPVAMMREIVDFDVEEFEKTAWEKGKEVQVESLSTERIQDFFDFLAREFPGDWNIVARMKVKSGAMDEILIALLDGKVVGYCQWEGEHFGPFGVGEGARNQRVGAKLFTEAVKRIRQVDGRIVWFNWADEGAARFYRRFGLGVTRRFSILRKDL
jgi:mycothiol synthase